MGDIHSPAAAVPVHSLASAPSACRNEKSFCIRRLLPSTHSALPLAASALPRLVVASFVVLTITVQVIPERPVPALPSMWHPAIRHRYGASVCSLKSGLMSAVSFAASGCSRTDAAGDAHVAL